MDTHHKIVRSSHEEASPPLTLPIERSPGHTDRKQPEPTQPTHACGPAFIGHTKYRDAALWWHRMGFDVLPILPKDKRPACQWTRWKDRLSSLRIRQHWTENPDHEVGFIVGDGIVVFDADSELAVCKLYELEHQFGMIPMLIAKTARGEHHFFKKDETLPCKTTFMLVGGANDRIDIKTGRTIVVLAPSTNKSIIKMGEGSTLEHASQHHVASTDFLEHFGAVKKLVSHCGTPREDRVVAPRSMRVILAGLNRLDPDCVYNDWLVIGAVIFNVSRGSDEGYQCFESWSGTGTKYKGARETTKKWNSFSLSHPRPATLASFRHMLSEQGHDWREICAEAAAEPLRQVDEGDPK